MTEEIKYLLEEIKDTTQDYVGTNGCKYQDLLREELDLLLNYITNLQKENEGLKKVISALGESEDFLQGQLNFYKSRNEKAVEYIKSMTNEAEFDLYNDELDDLHILLNILQGGDE